MLIHSHELFSSSSHVFPSIEQQAKKGYVESQVLKLFQPVHSQHDNNCREQLYGLLLYYIRI